jgi:predicted small metal-binding protein
MWHETEMKTMTCNQLGGACDLPFHANSFEEIAEMSKNHGMEMMKKSDEAHLQAMEEMMKRVMSPDAMQEWMESKRKEFDALPEDE